jgi:hypothetical protein
MGFSPSESDARQRNIYALAYQYGSAYVCQPFEMGFRRSANGASERSIDA